MKKRDFKVAAISVVVTLVVILVIAWVLHLFSFEIVYDPKVITNWDAVSGVAAWFGVIISVLSVGVSGLAIYYAIQVPKKIADRQDKIALFEKRYEVLQVYEKCINLYNAVSKQLTLDEFHNTFRIFFTERTYDELDGHYLTEKICYIERVLHQFPLLYSQISENDVHILYDALNSLLIGLVTSDLALAEKARYRYIDVMKVFKEKYQSVIWEETRIADIKI